MKILSKSLQSFDGIHHAFFTRRGGFSDGIYESRNCGRYSADHQDNVKRNLSLCAKDINIPDERLVTLCQCHSTKVITIDNSKRLPVNEEADALVTAIPNIGLGILTADCAPLLFYACDIHGIAAAHAGWRGALHGVVENTIETLCQMGAERENIHCAIGPCIHQQSYEVGPEFVAEFTGVSADYYQYFKASDTAQDKAFYDNPSFLADRLKASGVTHIETLPYDTYTHPEKFFSYRRTTHNNEPDYGRQLSVIALKP